MVDLNLWRLEYPGTVLEFGTHESGHPLTGQVSVSEVELETDDTPHPLSDGVMFGIDLARGHKLGFVGAHLTTMRQPRYRRWEPVMDGAAEFEGAWRARSVRKVAGAVATLANVDRGRLAYGRPRPYVPDYARVRQGWLTYACEFVTLDDKFYGLEEKVVVAGVDAGTVLGFEFPLSFPFTGAGAVESRAWIDNAGTDETWPVVTFRRGGNPRMDLLNDSGGIAWSLSVNGSLGAADVLVVDTRPWVRTVLLNGAPAPGLLRGTALADAVIPPGTFEARLTAADPTGLAEVEIRWRDAFGAL